MCSIFSPSHALSPTPNRYPSSISKFYILTFFITTTGVGFHVGSRSEVRYLVLQAHYATPLKEKDSSGVSLLYTLNP